MNLGLEAKVALVTGGAGYVGSAIVDTLRAEGATVIGASRSSKELSLDVRNGLSIEGAVNRLVTEYGRLDIVVVASGSRAQNLDPIRDTDPNSVVSEIGSKALSALKIANATLPVMQQHEWGRFVAINGQSIYLTTSLVSSVRNASLTFILRALADAYANTGVTVNVVNPGGVTDGPSEVPAIGTPGHCSPAEVAAAVAFLASEAAGGISGESLAVGHKVRGLATY